MGSPGKVAGHSSFKIVINVITTVTVLLRLATREYLCHVRICGVYILDV